MIVTAHQTAYMPWLGLLHKIGCADVFVLLDDVMHSRGSFENRNRVMASSGPAWLTVPLRRGSFVGGTKIRDLRVDNSQGWQRKHWRTIEQHYHGAPYWGDHRDFLKWVYETPWEALVDMNDAVLRYLMNKLDLTTRVVRQSELGAVGSKTDLIVDVCKKAGGWKFVFGSSGPEYVDPTRLSGVEAYVQTFDGMGDRSLWAFHHLLWFGVDLAKETMSAHGTLERLA